MDKNEFFRQATLRICGNLEIEEAMFSSLQFLRQAIPVDRMYLELYDESLKAMRVIATATLKEAKKVDWLTPISDEALYQLKQISKFISSDVYFTRIPAAEKLTQEMLSSLKIEATSLMVLKLDSQGKMIGAVVFISEGNDIFLQEHTELVSLLKEPFVIAMSNTLKHREVVQLKDLLTDDNRYLYRELRYLSGDNVIGANFGLKDVMEKVCHVAALNSPVLLLGETGVGKDVIANAIHYSSSCKDGPFVKVNCGAIPDTLIDSELFGYEKGAFTGAITQKRGRFERANKGTIFLDEIGELSPQAQVRLLRVLQDKEIERVGGNKSIKLDIRIIVATNRNLEEMVKANQFREDLWFRLNVFPIWIPPLRQRKSDIPALVQHFITKRSKEMKLSAVPPLAANAIKSLMNYNWPGNVRELENVVERALILNPKGPLTFDNLALTWKETAIDKSQQKSDIEKLDDIIVRHIRFALSRANGKIHGKGGAAELLGINPSTLRSRMNKLGIKVS